MVGDDRDHDLIPTAALGLLTIWRSDRACGEAVLSTTDFAVIRAFLVARAP